ncbi:GNAT family N-acetyltransferase [Paeniglutamicibacter sp. MACA_103]|uniref:GNAT family N-acetyltransferase n=1 Tax=Paeniglutamicibacter sp. MACA_103 TaxID=3377337 RepID=UPI00389569D8
MRVIENNRELLRYQLYELGDLAGFVQYGMQGDELWLHYTQLKRRYKSAELIEELLLHVLEDARRRRLAVMPFCPAMRLFIGDHPQYRRLVPEAWQERFLAPRSDLHSPMDKVRYTGSPKRRSTAAQGHQAVPSSPEPSLAASRQPRLSGA